MAQTTYSRGFSPASAGTPGSSSFGHRASFLNDEGTAIAAGIAVAYKSEGKIEMFDAAADVVAGIVMNDMVQDPDNLTGDQYAPDDAMVSILEEGAAYVHCEQSVTPADPVYVRYTVNTTELLGAFRKDADTGKARLLKGARFLTAGSSTVAPIVWFSRAADNAASLQDLEDAALVGAAVASLTDSSGGASADGTIGAITVPTALTGAGSGTANGALEAEGTVSTAGGNTYADSAVNTVFGKLENNIMELAASQTANITAITASRDAVKELATKLNALILSLRNAGVIAT